MKKEKKVRKQMNFEMIHSIRYVLEAYGYVFTFEETKDLLELILDETK